MGLLAWKNRLIHIGIPKAPRRSTISDGNKRRPSEVFKRLYLALFEKYRGVLPDSRLKLEVMQKLFIVNSTVISLFKDILKVSGRPRKDGRSKGGIKAHVMIYAAELMPCLVRFTEGSRQDHTFLKHINLPEGSFLVMDKGYTPSESFFRSNQIFSKVLRKFPLVDFQIHFYQKYGSDRFDYPHLQKSK